MEQTPRTGLGLLARPRLLLAAGISFCVVWMAAFIAHEIRTQGLVDRGGVAVGRDFLGFYAAGQLVLQGQGRSLYDPQLQQRAQTLILAPDRQRGYIYFVNPAFVAGIYAPLACLPYRLAVYLHAALMLLCFIGSMRVLRDHLLALQPGWPAAITLGCSWFPMIHTILGGQNAALSFLLLSWAYVSTTAGHQARAGLALGLQLYKPQLALPLTGLLLLRGRLLTAAVTAGVACLEYLAGSLVNGWRWPLTMARTLGGFYRSVERRVNGHKHIALPEVLDFSVAQPLERARHVRTASLVRVLGPGLAIAVLLHLLWTWRRAEPQAASFAPYWALATAITLLASLHTQHYESAVLLLPLLILLDRRVGRRRSFGPLFMMLMLSVYLFLPLLLLADVARRIQFQLWVLAPLGVAWWAYKEIRADEVAMRLP